MNVVYLNKDIVRLMDIEGVSPDHPGVLDCIKNRLAYSDRSTVLGETNALVNSPAWKQSGLPPAKELSELHNEMCIGVSDLSILPSMLEVHGTADLIVLTEPLNGLTRLHVPFALRVFKHMGKYLSGSELFDMTVFKEYLSNKMVTAVR